MSNLRNVLARQESAENKAFSLAKTGLSNEARWYEDDVKLQLKQLSNFSNTLSQAVVEERKRGIIDERAEGAAAWEEQQFSAEEISFYNEGKEALRDNKIKGDNVSQEISDNGGTFQQAEEPKKLTGWGLYEFTRRKAASGAENYQGWMEGQMSTNEDLQLSWTNEAGEQENFTPNTAKTLEQKSIAMRALRKKYFMDTGLANVNKVLLADVAYPTMSKASAAIMAKYREEDAVEKSQVRYEEALANFEDTKDFGVLLSSLWTLRDPKNPGRTFNRAGALDEAESIIKKMADAGLILPSDVDNIATQKITINGKETTVGKQWPGRMLRLKEDVQEARNANTKLKLENRQDSANQIRDTFHDWVEEKKEKGEDITEDELRHWRKRYREETGMKDPTWLKDFQTTQERLDELDKERLDILRQGKGFLEKSDLTGVSPAVFKSYASILTQDKTLADAVGGGGYSKKRNDLVNKMARQAASLGGDDKDTYQSRAGYYQAIADFDVVFRDALKEVGDPNKAFAIAQQHVFEKFNLDKIGQAGKPSTADSDYFKIAVPSKEDRAQANILITAGIDQIIGTDVKNDTKEKKLAFLSKEGYKIPGSDFALKEAAQYKTATERGQSATIPWYYTRLARKFPKLSGWEIMNAQLIATTGEGLGIKPPPITAAQNIKAIDRKLGALKTQQSVKQAIMDIEDFYDLLNNLPTSQ